MLKISLASQRVASVTAFCLFASFASLATEPPRLVQRDDDWGLNFVANPRVLTVKMGRYK